MRARLARIAGSSCVAGACACPSWPQSSFRLRPPLPAGWAGRGAGQLLAGRALRLVGGGTWVMLAAVLQLAARPGGEAVMLGWTAAAAAAVTYGPAGCSAAATQLVGAVAQGRHVP